MNEQAAPTSHVTSDDERFMRLALALGRRNLGHTWPNPAVGAVIVKDGIIIARGWTQSGGRPHAEVEALRRAKKTAEGATMQGATMYARHERLRAKGIVVDIGLGADEARRAHAGHIMRMQKGRPYVTLKLALSKDGKAGLAGRKQIALSGEAARER